jgi:hypothetical protein
MKTIYLQHSLSKACLVLALSGLSSPWLLAQVPGSAIPRAPGPPPGIPYTPLPLAPQLPPKAAKRFDLDFPGGTPSTLVAAISKALDHPLNVIIMPQDQALEIPPLTLKAVTVADLFTTLDQVSRRQVPRKKGKNIEFVPTSISFGSTNGVDEDAVWYLSNPDPNRELDKLEHQANEVKSVKIFSLRGLTESETFATFEQQATLAIKSVWELAEQPATPTNALQFQAGPLLLLAKGSDLQIQLVEEVLQKLTSPRPQKPTTVEVRKGQEGSAEETLRTLLHNIGTTQFQLAIKAVGVTSQASTLAATAIPQVEIKGEATGQAEIMKYANYLKTHNDTKAYTWDAPRFGPSQENVYPFTITGKARGD